MPEISVVIPHYNHSAFLRKCVQSCLEQSFPPHEIIIVDDASRRAELAIVEQLAAKHTSIRLIRHERNLGSTAAHNTGLEAATGDYVLARAADDVTLPGFFEAAMRMLEANPEAGICCGDVIYFADDPSDGQVERLALSKQPRFLPPYELARCLTPHHLIHGATVIASREKALSAGGFRPELKWYCDWFLYLSLALRHGLCYLPQTVAAFRLDASSYGNAGTRQVDAQHAVLRELLHAVQNDAPDLIPALRTTRIFAFFHSQLSEATASEPALEHLRRSLLPGDADKNAVETDVGVPGVIRRRLLELHSQLQSLQGKRICLYGVGGHSETLLHIWSQLELPPFQLAITSETPEQESWNGIPLRSIEETELASPDLVALSSKSYESAMAERCAKRFPHAMMLTFWNPSLTRLIDGDVSRQPSTP